MFRAPGSVGAPASAATAGSAVTAALTGSFADSRNSVPPTAPFGGGTYPGYSKHAALTGAVGFAGGMSLTYLVLTCLALAGAELPLLLASVMAPAVGLTLGALAVQTFFVLNPPASDAEWSGQRFWSVAALSLSVALAVIPILLAVHVSAPTAIIAGIASGGITTILGHLLWPVVNPRPSSVPKPDGRPPPPRGYSI